MADKANPSTSIFGNILVIEKDYSFVNFHNDDDDDGNDENDDDALVKVEEKDDIDLAKEAIKRWKANKDIFSPKKSSRPVSSISTSDILKNVARDMAMMNGGVPKPSETSPSSSGRSAPRCGLA